MPPITSVRTAGFSLVQLMAVVTTAGIIAMISNALLGMTGH
jgi:hypothetical protein